MKFLSFLLLVVSFSSHALIIDSDYEHRHQVLIETAVDNACGVMRTLKQESSRTVENRVDQGIIDVTYITEFLGLQKADEHFYDKYRIKVVSTRFDSYDHATREWGVYEVQEVSCERLK